MPPVVMLAVIVTPRLDRGARLPRTLMKSASQRQRRQFNIGSSGALIDPAWKETDLFERVLIQRPRVVSRHNTARALVQ